jgi:hypothetical protein
LAAGDGSTFGSKALKADVCLKRLLRRLSVGHEVKKAPNSKEFEGSR